MAIDEAIADLRANHEPPPRPRQLPSAEEVAQAETKLGVQFPPDYRRFLLEASDVLVGTLEPCVIGGGGYRDLVNVAPEAWAMGVPRNWLPICEDNADYYCLDGDVVRYWSHNGSTDEHWPNLATWIEQVWIGGE